MTSVIENLVKLIEMLTSNSKNIHVECNGVGQRNVDNR